MRRATSDIAASKRTTHRWVHYWLTSIISFAACAAPPPLAVAPPTGPQAQQARTQEPEPEASDQVLSRADLAAYHGWIKYLGFLAQRAQLQSPGQQQERAAHLRLREWSQRILENPNLLTQLRGVHEWAYESPVDGSGQPFRLHIPLDYDSAESWPLALQLHGYSGNHLEHSVDMQAHSGYFEAAVLGRSRGAGFRGLGEADVLHVLDYLERHFSIDARRVHLAGGSMGGEGSYWLAARYPHRFASVRAACGWATSIPLTNLLHLPSYAVHSNDDYTVPVLMMRGPAARLEQMGASLIYEEVTGYGHAVWNHHEAAARARIWSQAQQSPLASEQRRIDFVALDGSATRAYWAEITEWGNQPRPARIVLEVGPHNELTAKFDNTQSATLHLSEGPFTSHEPITLLVDGERKTQLPAPLPNSIRLSQRHGHFAFEPVATEPQRRLHTPGGANQLYAGGPLLIIYGTQGTPQVKQAMLELARAASKSSTAIFNAASQDAGPDGVPHNQMLYGSLPIKADTEVSSADLTQHLVLIGSATQNLVTQRLAKQLPASIDASRVTLGDGTELPGADRALGLFYYNPVAEQRLLYWIAADEPAGYQPGALTSRLMGTLTGADLVVTESSSQSLITTRSFDSNWAFNATSNGPVLPQEVQTRAELAAAIAETVRQINEADFALAGFYPETNLLPLPSQTRDLAQLSQLFYFDSMGVMTLHGADLMRVHKLLKGSAGRLLPAPDAGRIHERKQYSVALLSEQLWRFTALTRMAPEGFRLQTEQFSEALLEHGLAAPQH